MDALRSENAISSTPVGRNAIKVFFFLPSQQINTTIEWEFRFSLGSSIRIIQAVIVSSTTSTFEKTWTIYSSIEPIAIEEVVHRIEMAEGRTDAALEAAQEE